MPVNTTSFSAGVRAHTRALDAKPRDRVHPGGQRMTKFLAWSGRLLAIREMPAPQDPNQVSPQMRRARREVSTNLRPTEKKAYEVAGASL
jgi:hypothetical protein